MSVFGKPPTIQHEIWEAASQGRSRARTSPEEAQRRIRRKMRIHPRSASPVFVPGPGKKWNSEEAESPEEQPA